MLLHRAISHRCAVGHHSAAPVHLDSPTSVSDQRSTCTSAARKVRGEKQQRLWGLAGPLPIQYCAFREETEYRMTITWDSVRVYVGCAVGLVHIPPQYYYPVCQCSAVVWDIGVFNSLAGWQDGCRHLHRSVMQPIRCNTISFALGPTAHCMYSTYETTRHIVRQDQQQL
jgi:hypothetical protein